MYRILSPTAILGYGFPKSSFENAMKLEIDLIAVDAGSMDAGPFYLGSEKQYVGTTALERDLRIMIKGAISQQCPLIIGSAGFSGASPQINEIISIVKKTIEDENADDTKIAIVRSDINFELLEPLLDNLTPLGKMPPLDKSLVAKSKMVGQMGIEPIVAALGSGAQFVVCGRAYDPAVFAADPIRKGYPKGIAFHAAKILECGAIACEPGSGSDCLIAELHEDGRAIFYPTNENRKATVKSISAHTLYEKSRPDIFHMPGGILSIQNTRFFQVDDKKAGFEGSEFKGAPYSIKIEGSASLGERVISIIPLKSVENVSNEIRVYGRNGVEETKTANPINEMGILTIVKSKKENVAKDALSFLRSTMLHYGYDGRISTAGNLAFPFSPSDILVRDQNDNYLGMFVAGTRDPIFQQKWKDIKNTVMSSLKEQHESLFDHCEIEFVISNDKKPIAILENIETDMEGALRANRHEWGLYAHNIDESRPIFKEIKMGKCYTWSVHHLIHDLSFIEKLFVVEFQKYHSNVWGKLMSKKASYLGSPTEDDKEVSIDEDKNKIENCQIKAEQGKASVSLYKLANVIRSKNAGINELTYDILFMTEEAYQLAIKSNVFAKNNIAQTLQIDEKSIVGCFKYDPALAIKFTLHRANLSGGVGERDVFGAQQHTQLLGLKIPR